MVDAAIRTSELSKTYKGGVRALASLSLEVPTGCCFGLLGPNGAGKSTLVKALLSIVYPTTGSAELFGVDIARPEARRGVGYLPEGHRFPRYLTGRGVCRYFGRLSGLHGPELEREIEEKLELVGMREWGDTKITKYSKGMNQRVGLAQAMLGNPRLMFLDEPTDGVDPMGRKDMRVLIREYANKGHTVFLNSHLLSEVEMVCDRVAILDKGVVVVQGTIDEITQTVQSSRSDRWLVRIEVVPPPEDRKAALSVLLRKRSAQIDANCSHIEVQIQEQSELDALIDELRGVPVSIRAITPQRTSLEDAFVKILRGEENGEEEPHQS